MFNVEELFGSNVQNSINRLAVSGESVVLVCITESNNPKKLYLMLLDKAVASIGLVTPTENIRNE
jgi:hypothetical protein